MEKSLIYRQLKLIQDKSLDDLIVLIEKIAEEAGRDFNLPIDCAESLVEDLPMLVFKHWYQYPPKIKL